ncbi:hypothetical protein QAD02_004604 [Eretmocerus hayati]|uniref:Uncharacterized protein n=1 Tax=Eretmocerus hayati TaxID=131215 RepID=A0ACC2NQF4_9HYME|nr:hypothetical protein QAD02_004604 [Eretmocerus hayati]
MYRTTLAYILCKTLDDFETSCDLIVNMIESGYSPKICPNFLKEEPDDNTGIKAKVFLFDDDRVIVVWASYTQCNKSKTLKIFFAPRFSCEIQTTIVNLNNERLKVDQVLENLLILRTTNGYEMLHKDVCENVCSVIFDNEGLMLQKPNGTNPTGRALGYFVHPAEFDSNLHKNAGYCFLTQSQERLNASLLFTQDTRFVLNSAIRNGFEASTIKVSTASGILSICKQNSKDREILTCSRGNSTLWLDLKFLEVFEDPVVYNLPEGRFLVVASRKRQSIIQTEKKYYEFLLTAFDADGKQGYSVFVEKAYCRDGLDNVYVHIFESEGGLYCVSFFIQDQMFRVIVRCYPESILFGESPSDQ